MFLASNYNYTARLETDDFIVGEGAKFIALKQQIEKTFLYVYQGLRLISLMPAIRSIEGGNLQEGEKSAVELGRFNERDRATIQQVYNNLAVNVKVSEVYCVIEGFKPEKKETPFFMYDELILKTKSGFVEIPKYENEDVPKEFEGDEYEWFKVNIPIIKQNHPAFDFLNIYGIPCYISTEMKTCDNTHYISKSKGSVDATNGIIMAVPFYDYHDNFKGVIATIFLSQALEAILLDRPFIPVTENDIAQANRERWTLPKEPGRFLLANEELNIHIFDKRSKDLISEYKSKVTTAKDNLSNDKFIIEQLKLPFGESWKLFYSIDKKRMDVIKKEALWSMLMSSVAVIILGLFMIGLIFKNAELRNEILKKIEKDRGIEVAMARVEVESKRASELKIAYDELKEIQDELLQSEKLSAIGQLASGVAHEVRNPLGIIMQGVAYLEQIISPEAKEPRETLSIVKESAQRADKIVISLLDFSRATKLELHPEHIAPIVENSLNLVKAEFKNIKVVREIQEDLPKVLVDKNKLTQVFVNLFINAVHAMPEAGKLTIRSFVRQLEETRKDIGRRLDDYFEVGEKVVVVEIEDTGMGISEENLKRVFDPFFTTKGPGRGTGLGLSVTRNIIIMHKGLIEIESQVKKGTRVIITLRISKEKGESNV